MIPFSEFRNNISGIIRVFEDNVDQDDLNWHKDHKDRKVKVLEAGPNWKVQFDNKLPSSIKNGDVIYVKAKEWHRVIKGDGVLVIQIEEY
jgi:urease accessory protein UreE